MPVSAGCQNLQFACMNSTTDAYLNEKVRLLEIIYQAIHIICDGKMWNNYNKFTLKTIKIQLIPLDMLILWQKPF